MNDSPTDIKIAPAPWSCKCTAYVFAFFHPKSSPLPLDVAYAPLEASSAAFSSQSQVGTYEGGLCLGQIIRYTDTPVGSYDEFALLPGYFNGPGGKHSRISAIYVSQKDTCYNGRKNWNIPKHLATFTFTPTSPSASSLLPLKATVTPISTPSNPAFTFTIHPFPSFLSFPFPFSSSWASYFGFNSTIMQPPLPQGEGEFKDVEVGTEEWKACKPVLRTQSARMCWVDLRQDRASQDEGKMRENWWPGLGRWRMGMWLENAVLTLGEPEKVKDKTV